MAELDIDGGKAILDKINRYVVAGELSLAIHHITGLIDALHALRYRLQERQYQQPRKGL